MGAGRIGRAREWTEGPDNLIGNINVDLLLLIVPLTALFGLPLIVLWTVVKKRLSRRTRWIIVAVGMTSLLGIIAWLGPLLADRVV